MLQVATPFPHVGSYALFIDDRLPIGEQRAELVRIMRRPTICERGGDVAVAFPLRTGASGSMLVDDGQLIDGTALAKTEERELTDLLNYIRARVRPAADKMARAEALRRRLIYSQLLAAELAKLGRLAARGQPSTGAILPRHAA